MMSEAITVDDYPAISIRLQEQGVVKVRFVVSVDGTVRDCTVAVSSGKSRLDEAACAMVIRRWRYRPSLDENGMPVDFATEADVVFMLR